MTNPYKELAKVLGCHLFDKKISAMKSHFILCYISYFTISVIGSTHLHHAITMVITISITSITLPHYTATTTTNTLILSIQSNNIKYNLPKQTWHYG